MCHATLPTSQKLPPAPVESPVPKARQLRQQVEAHVKHAIPYAHHPGDGVEHSDGRMRGHVQEERRRPEVHAGQVVAAAFEMEQQRPEGDEDGHQHVVLCLCELN